MEHQKAVFGGILKQNSHIYSQQLIQKSELKTFEKLDSFEVMQKAAKTSFDYINDFNQTV